MPHVELLPISATTATPGWTYVVDTGYDPSKVAINPKNRKRIAAQPASTRNENELSSRQQTAIARRIAELDRDNDPKHIVTIPGKWAPPNTQNARRIIQYQRQIKHWLDEEEAQLAVGGSGRAEKSARRQSEAASGTYTALPSLPQPTTYSTSFADDALLSIEIEMPPPLNPPELDILLASLPLSYAASHVEPPASGGPPQRHFCDNCGYWGSIRCRRCGARVCGLECRDAHEGTRCLKWA